MSKIHKVVIETYNGGITLVKFYRKRRGVSLYQPTLQSFKRLIRMRDTWVFAPAQGESGCYKSEWVVSKGR